MRKYGLNESFFEKVDSENKAYWLGFILTDGYIGTKRGKLSYLNIELQLSDSDHLDKFKKDIEYEGPIYVDKKRNRCRLIISSIKLVNDLGKLGIHNKKSLTAEPIEFKDASLQKAFWRGCIDGDGTIFKLNPKDRKEQWCIGLYGTENICKAFASYIKKVTHSKSNNFQKREGCFHFRINSNKFTKLAHDHLYGNANIYLTRKREII